MFEYIPNNFKKYKYVLCFKENKTKNYKKTLETLFSTHKLIK